MKKLEAIIFSLGLALLSCKNEQKVQNFKPKNNPCRNYPGEVYLTTKDGRSNGRCLNGTLQGEVQVGYDKGFFERGLYIDGKPHGAHTLFRPNGEIDQVMVYDHGKPVYAAQWREEAYLFRLCETPGGPILANPDSPIAPLKKPQNFKNPKSDI